jgi:hypothetical protein
VIVVSVNVVVKLGAEGRGNSVYSGLVKFTQTEGDQR